MPKKDNKIEITTERVLALIEGEEPICTEQGRTNRVTYRERYKVGVADIFYIDVARDTAQNHQVVEWAARPRNNNRWQVKGY